MQKRLKLARRNSAAKAKEEKTFCNGYFDQFIEDMRHVFFETRRSRDLQMRRELRNRLQSYGVRIQYLCWNIFGVCALYIFGDTKLTEWWKTLDFNSVLMLMLYHGLLAISMTFYYLASLSDPGFVPLFTDEEQRSFLREVMINEHSEIARVSINGNQVPRHWCWKCKFIRPMRSKHCFYCGRCVMQFDHHCPVVGNCVGAYNHRYFLIFIVTESVFCVWSELLGLSSVINAARMSLLSSQSLSSDFFVLVLWICRGLFVILVLFACCVCVSLASFHCYLCVTGQKTYDTLKPQVLESYLFPERFDQQIINDSRRVVSIEMAADHQGSLEHESPSIDDEDGSSEGSINRETETLMDSNNSAGALHLQQRSVAGSPRAKRKSADSNHNSNNKSNLKSNQLNENDDNRNNQLMSEMIRLGTGNEPSFSYLGPEPKPAIEGRLIRKHSIRLSQVNRDLSVYLNEGIFTNISRFFSADLKPEWMTPQPAVLDT